MQLFESTKQWRFIWTLPNSSRLAWSSLSSRKLRLCRFFFDKLQVRARQEIPFFKFMSAKRVFLSKSSIFFFQKTKIQKKFPNKRKTILAELCQSNTWPGSTRRTELTMATVTRANEEIARRLLSESTFYATMNEFTTIKFFAVFFVRMSKRNKAPWWNISGCILTRASLPVKSVKWPLQQQQLGCPFCQNWKLALI